MSTKARCHNFSAGPGCLPVTVLEEIASELVTYQDTGMSMLEASHRDAGGPCQTQLTEACDLVRELLDVPTNYHVLLFAGGAHGQFAGLPMNLAYESGKVDFVDSGVWAQKAMVEAKKTCDVSVCATVTNAAVPASEWNYRPDAGYIHLCLNETLTGVEYLSDPELPEGAPPLVCDATSTLMSRPVDISKYGCIYASGGKNCGTAGVTVVIVREDLVERKEHPCTPGILSLKEQAHSKPIPNIYNTPPVFQIYLLNKVLAHYKACGGTKGMMVKARARADMLYQAIDSSNGFYLNDVENSSRSRMNVCFSIVDSKLVDLFLTEAKRNGLEQLLKHPAHGGLRVTLYNGLEDESVDAVVEYMKKFQQLNETQTCQREAGIRISVGDVLIAQ